MTLNTHSQQEVLLLSSILYLLTSKPATKAINSSLTITVCSSFFFGIGGDCVLLEVDGLPLFYLNFVSSILCGSFRATSAFYEALSRGRMCEC